MNHELLSIRLSLVFSDKPIGGGWNKLKPMKTLFFWEKTRLILIHNTCKLDFPGFPNPLFLSFQSCGNPILGLILDTLPLLVSAKANRSSTLGQISKNILGSISMIEPHVRRATKRALPQTLVPLDAQCWGCVMVCGACVFLRSDPTVPVGLQLGF